MKPCAVRADLVAQVNKNKESNMSLKENVNYIKEEIGQEEKMLEGLIRFEGWFKKYKLPLLALTGLIVATIIGSSGYEYLKEREAQKISAIYSKLLENPDDSALLAKLKSSGSTLYELFLFHKGSQNSDKAILEGLKDSKDEIIASLAAYQLASLSKDSSQLATYTQKDKTLFGDLAFMGRAYLLMGEGKIAEANEILQKIPADSPIKSVAKFLEHYTLKGEAK
ncbi:MAG: hypothetical protein ACTTJS_01895 [Wolinella sp.]